MFKLPSLWNLIVSTVVFILAAWWIRKWLEDMGIAKNMMRGFIIFVLAYAASWASGEAVDWVHEKAYGFAASQPPPTALYKLTTAPSWPR